MAEPTETSPPSIRVDGLTKRFGRSVVLDGVSVEIRPGVTGMLGPNGAGKTTLLRIMATVLAADAGEVRFGDLRPTSAQALHDIRRDLGYAPQEPGFYPNFTVFEFIEYFALLKEIPPAQARRATAAAIERVELGDRARSKLRTLSGGMLRRVGIAQAIVNDPGLLLLDEPTAGLDPEQRVGFRSLLRDIGTGATVVVSTHLVEDVGAACDRVGLMLGGRIVFHGTPGELTEVGQGFPVGDAPLERGYAAVLAEARS